MDKIKCKRYPDRCHEAPELDAFYEHGVCLDCKDIPDEYRRIIDERNNRTREV